MSKRKAAALLDIGESTLFRWIKRIKEGKELKVSRPKQVIKKIDPENYQGLYRKKARGYLRRDQERPRFFCFKYMV